MFVFRMVAGAVRRGRPLHLAIESLERRTVPAAAIGDNFTGASIADSGFIPPDTDGAVGPNHYVEFINGVFRVYGKAAPHTIGANKGDDQFWIDAGIPSSVVAGGVSDPRVVYDPLSGRWFASEINVDNLGNTMLIARSDTNDPNGAWHAARFIQNSTLFADYDTLGVDANGVYIGSDNFNSSNNATSATVTSIPKADLLLSTPDVSRRKVVQRSLSGSPTYGWTPQPVTNFGANPAHASILGVNFAGTASPSHVFRTTIVWGADPANPTFNPATSFTPQPTFYPDVGHQPDANTPLDPVDDRFGAMTYQVGDLIYAVHSISVNSSGVAADYTTNTTTDGVRLTIFSDSQNTIVAEKTWFNTSFDYIDPSICANAAGDFVIGFTRVGPASGSGRAGAYAVPGRIDPVNTAAGITFEMELPTLKAGAVDSYHPQGSGFIQRWGDYSATNVDPNNQTAFWTIQEYAAGTNSWGTQITQIYVSPRVSGVSSTIGNGTYGVPTVIPITITFNDAVVVNTSGGTPSLALNAGGTAVATYASGSGTNTLTFNYTVAPGQSAADLDYTTTTALSLNGGTIRDVASNLDVITTLASPGAAGSLGNSMNIVIDTTPRVGNVTSTVANATYGVGASIPITVTFSSAVVVTGTPQLALNAGGGAVANFSSGSGSATLTFNYVVAAGQSSPDLDYTSTNALTLNGGTIKDQANAAVNAVLTLPAPGAAGSLGFNKNIVIDAAGASISNVTSPNGNATYGFNSTISVTVTFTGNVLVTGSPKLALNSSGTAAATYVSGSGGPTLTFNYTVAAGDFSADLDYASTTALTLNGGTIKDQSTGLDAQLTLPSPGAAGSLGANKNIVIDALPAKVMSVNSPNPNDTYGFGATIAVAVTFDKPVTVTGFPKLALNSNAAAAATYASGSGGLTLTFNYTVAAGDSSSDLDYTSTTALTLNGGTIVDQATGVDANRTLPSPGAAGSLGANKNIVIDALAAKVTNVTSITPDATYDVGASISITVTFDKPVIVTGSPKLALNSNASASATFTGGSGTTALTFAYTVAPGDFSADLDYASTGALTLNGGTITDLATGTNASLALPSPGAAGSLGFNKNIVISALPARPSNVTSPLANGAYGINAVIPITITFTKAVTVSGTPQITLNSSGTAVATYASSSGGNVLTFNYTVQGGDSSPDLDYTSASALSGGTITDVASGNPADLTLPAPGAAGSLGFNKNLLIDATGPGVVSFKVLFGSKSYDLLTSTRVDLPWRITGIQAVFSEPIYFGTKLSLSGIAARKLTGLRTTTLNWTFSGISKGSFNTSLLNTGTNALKDIAGNPIAAFGQAFKVLYGDFNDDQVVNAADEAGVRASVASPYDLHPTGYNLFADLSGDGIVSLVDVGIAHNRKGQSLP